MPEMKAENSKELKATDAKEGSKTGFKEGSKENHKYFRGDELPTATIRAALTPTN